jgi:hypothetical protein
MGYLPYDFQLWNALVNLLKDLGVSNPSNAVGCWQEEGQRQYRVKVAGAVRGVLGSTLSKLLGREFDAEQSTWTLYPREAVIIVRPDII